MADDEEKPELKPERLSKPARILADAVNRQDEIEAEILADAEPYSEAAQDLVEQTFRELNGKPFTAKMAKKLARECALLALRAYAVNAERVKESAMVRHAAGKKLGQFSDAELADLPPLTREDRKPDGEAD